MDFERDFMKVLEKLDIKNRLGKINLVGAVFNVYILLIMSYLMLYLHKGKYGNVTLKHISVYIPKEHAADTQMIKNLLLKRFDVFCDVAVAEDEDEEAE